MAYFIIMLRAVTNRDFPMLRRSLRSLFGMELDHDPSLRLEGRSAIWRFVHTHFSGDPGGRIRIIFVDTEDLSYGRARDVDVTGHNIPCQRLILIGVPESIETQSEECYETCTMDAYLLVIVLHELYELFTSDFDHCDNPGRCINSECGVYDVGTCSACMGYVVDEMFPDIKLEDLYCAGHLAKLKPALKKWNGHD
jgi:hypothetical protein